MFKSFKTKSEAEGFVGRAGAASAQKPEVEALEGPTQEAPTQLDPDFAFSNESSASTLPFPTQSPSRGTVSALRSAESRFDRFGTAEAEQSGKAPEADDTEYWAVARGRRTGVFVGWEAAAPHVLGYAKPLFAAFGSERDARAFLRAATGGDAADRPERTSSGEAGRGDRAVGAAGRGAGGGGASEPMLRSASQFVRASSLLRGGGAGAGAGAVVATAGAGRPVLQFDGGARGNPGPAGSGAALFEPGAAPATARPVWEGRLYGGRLTNNEAEYMGLVMGLREAKRRGVERLLVQGDSKLVVEQLRGRWRVKATNLQPLFSEAKRLLRGINGATVEHIYRDSNKVADRLANEAMDLGLQGKLPAINVASFVAGADGHGRGAASAARGAAAKPEASGSTARGERSAKQSRLE